MASILNIIKAPVIKVCFKLNSNMVSHVQRARRRQLGFRTSPKSARLRRGAEQSCLRLFLMNLKSIFPVTSTETCKPASAGRYGPRSRNKENKPRFPIRHTYGAKSMEGDYTKRVFQSPLPISQCTRVGPGNHVYVYFLIKAPTGNQKCKANHLRTSKMILMFLCDKPH